MKFKILLAMTLCLSACVTAQKNSAAKAKWESVLQSKEFQDEKEILVKRLNGANICFDSGVSDFFNNRSAPPASSCLYFPSKMFVDSDGELRQAIQQLKVLQVVQDGFVIKSPDYRNDQIVFIHRSDEKGIVDGAFLDLRDGFGLYKYMGTYQYQSLTGPKTVYSFKRLTNDEIRKVQQGLKSYGAMKEYYIRNELWDRLEQQEQQR